MKQPVKGTASKAAKAKARAAGEKAYNSSPGKGTSGSGTMWYDENSLKNARINSNAAASKSLTKPVVKTKKATPKKKK